MANIESATLKSPLFGQVIVMAHNENLLGDDEWEQNYLTHVRAARKSANHERSANLVFAEGWGPTPKQRAAGNAIFGKDAKYEFRVAVVTNSIMVRGAVIALGWFNPLIGAFGPDAWRDARNQVRMNEAHDDLLLQTLQEVSQKLGACAVLERCIDQIAKRAVAA